MNILQDSIKGKVVLITGGTRGIGFATAKAFLQNGAKVCICGSRKETVDKALEELQRKDKDGDVIGLYPNLLNFNDIKATVDEVVSKWGTLDVLINNAGISDGTPIYDQDDEHFAKVIDINVQAVFNFSKLAAEVMKKQKKGVILNTSSVVSLYAQPTGVGYPTSKFAVNGMTKSLARELGADGIRVNAIAPGVIKTDMVAALDKSVIDHLASSIPVGRLGEAEDIANAFLFLASDMASYISGAILSVDGATII